MTTSSAAFGTLLPATTNVIDVAWTRLDDDCVSPYSEACAVLSSAEQDRADRFRFSRDRRRFVRARAFLRHLLADRLGSDAGVLDFTAGPHGKPFLLDHKIHFNLSHTEDIAVCAVSTSGAVGIDAETIERSLDVSGIAEHCFLDAELRELAQLCGTERRRRFYEFWTAKEARMKLTGEGMSLEPKKIQLTLHGGRPVGYELPATQEVSASFVGLPVHGLICCVAAFGAVRIRVEV